MTPMRRHPWLSYWYDLLQIEYDPVPNRVPNLGVRGDFGGQMWYKIQQVTDFTGAPDGFESLSHHQFIQ